MILLFNSKDWARVQAGKISCDHSGQVLSRPGGVGQAYLAFFREQLSEVVEMGEQLSLVGVADPSFHFRQSLEVSLQLAVLELDHCLQLRHLFLLVTLLLCDVLERVNNFPVLAGLVRE